MIWKNTAFLFGYNFKPWILKEKTEKEKKQNCLDSKDE